MSILKLIALAFSRYFENHRRHGRDHTLSVFHGRISWAQLAERYGETLFSRADLLYGSSPESGLASTTEGEGGES